MEQKQESKTKKEQLQADCSAITQEILSLASLSEVTKVMGICSRIVEYGWSMYELGVEVAIKSLKGKEVSHNEGDDDECNG